MAGETLELKMTWEAAVNVIVELLTNDPDPETILTCRKELIRLARAQDARNIQENQP